MRDSIDVGLVTLTNGASSWISTSPFGVSNPSNPGDPPAISVVLVTAGVGCTNLLPINVSISYEPAFGWPGKFGIVTGKFQTAAYPFGQGSRPRESARQTIKEIKFDTYENL